MYGPRTSRSYRSETTLRPEAINMLLLQSKSRETKHPSGLCVRTIVNEASLTGNCHL